MHRIKNGRDYYVLPWGHFEPGESKESVLIRELKEETNLDVKINSQLWVLNNPVENSKDYIFLVTDFSGVIALGGPELINNSEQNKYMLEWHNLNDISKLNLVPDYLKQRIISEFIN